jgi:hypothetical protein
MHAASSLGESDTIRHLQDPDSSDPIYKVGAIKYYTDEYWPLGIGDLGALSSLSTFFIVFYAGNCFARYNTLYGAVTGISGKMHNVSLYVRVYFLQPTNRWTVVRYLLGGSAEDRACGNE